MREKIEKTLREILYESWMDESDYQELIELVSKEYGSVDKMYEKFEADINIGIANGYSYEQQMEIAKKFL